MVEIIYYEVDEDQKLIGFRDHIKKQAGFIRWYTGEKLKDEGLFEGGVHTWYGLYKNFTYSYITLFNFEI